MTAAIGQDEAASFFENEAPPGLSDELLRIVIAAYPVAFGLAQQYPYAEAHDLRPYIRRATIERSLASLGEVFPVRVASMPNSTGNASHRELSFGRIVLTHSMISTREARIRDAQFRQSLARSCNLPMFSEFAEPAPDDDGLLWSVLVHGPAEDHLVPAFVGVAFPLLDGSHSFDLDLVARRTAAQASSGSQPTTEPEPQPVLRPEIVEQAEEEELGS